MVQGLEGRIRGRVGLKTDIGVSVLAKLSAYSGALGLALGVLALQVDTIQSIIGTTSTSVLLSQFVLIMTALLALIASVLFAVTLAMECLENLSSIGRYF